MIRLARSLWMLLLSYALAADVFAASGQDEGRAAASPAKVQPELAQHVIELDRLHVLPTGTRIPRAGFDTLEPAHVISREDITTQNVTHLADLIGRTPSFDLGATSAYTQSSLAVGANYAARFGLGTNRLLTLVNGRRFVSANPPSVFAVGGGGNQVDLNFLPTNLIESVENISVGGAPSYGSDAISGVSNLILRDRFDGVEIGMGYGMTGRGDGERSHASALFGTAFAAGRGHLVLSLSHDNQSGLPLSARQHFRRGYSLVPNPDAQVMSHYQPGREASSDGRLDGSIPFDSGGADGVPARVYIRDTRTPTTTPGGLVLPLSASLGPNPEGRLRGFGGEADRYLRFNPYGELVEYDPGITFGSNAAAGGDGLKAWEGGQLLSAVERKTIFLLGHRDLGDYVSAFWEASSHVASAREVRRWATFNSTFDVAHLHGSGEQDGMLLMPIDHPLLTEPARKRLQGLGVGQFLLSRPLNDVVEDAGTSNSKLWRVVAGLKGHFIVGGRGFDWDVSGVRGHTDSVYLRNGLIQQNFINALNVTRTPDGRVVCDGTAAGTTPDPDCVALDLFGEGRASRQARDYVTMPSRATSANAQTVFNANLTGEIAKLPGGMMSFNAGYEFRREQARFEPGRYQRDALGRRKSVAASANQVDSNELFGEVFAPLVDAGAQIPALHRLDLTLKLRRVVGSVNGGFTAYTYGFQYEPLAGLLLRGNRTRSFRAPSLVELHAEQPSASSIDEPCQATNLENGRRPEKRAANCAAFFAAYPGADPATFEGPSGQVPARLLGNPQLRNEKADSWTAGMVLQPAWAQGLRMALDYQSIDLSDVIVGLRLPEVLSGCFDADSFSGNPACAWVRRDPINGLAREVDIPYVNGPLLNFRGWTAEAAYRLDLAGYGWGRGNLDLAVYAYFPLTLRRTAFRGVPGVNLANAGGQNRTYQWTARYGVGRWNLGATANYTPSHPVGPGIGRESQQYHQVNGYLSVAANVGYRLNEHWRMNLAVDNLTDDIGPFPLALDAIGRRYMLTVTMKR